MLVKKIRIEKFRSIKKAEINLNSLTALVGENNVGKSTVLRAFNAFFNFEEEEENFLNRRHLFETRNNTKIEVFFEIKTNVESYSSFITGNTFSVEFQYIYSNNKKKYILKNGNSKSDIRKEFWDKLKENIQFVLIPLDRNYLHLQWKQSTILKEVVYEFLKRATKRRDTISSKVKEISSKIKNSAFDKISKEIEKYYFLTHNFKFEINHKEDIDYKLLLNDIQLLINDYDKSFEISDCGSGIQSLSVIALYRYLANLRHSNFIIGIEEPETNLHPQTQREFINSVKNNSVEDLQIIFTTHSSVIVDELEHNEIALFNKKEDLKRGFITTVSQIPKEFWEKYDLTEFSYYQFYKYRNSDFFFSKFVIIVESKNDAEVLKLILKNLEIDINSVGISILNLEGIKKLKYTYYLIKNLNMDFLIILDKDYFIPYLNDELDKSRNSNGFPKYRYEYKSNQLDLIKEIIPDERVRTRLLKEFKRNHSSAMNTLENYNVICFRYMLEIDLIASDTGANIYYEHLNISEQNKNKLELLKNRKKQIKDIRNILEVIKRLPYKNYPNSYKRIRNFLKNKFKSK